METDKNKTTITKAKIKQALELEKIKQIKVKEYELVKK